MVRREVFTLFTIYLSRLSVWRAVGEHLFSHYAAGVSQCPSNTGQLSQRQTILLRRISQLKQRLQKTVFAFNFN